MLKQRVLTAILLAALVIWGIISQPVPVIFYSLLVVILVSAWEWAQLSGIKSKFARAVYAVFVVLSVFAAQKVIDINPQWINIVLLITVLGWFFAIYHMITTGPLSVNQSLSMGKVFIGFVALIPPVLALMLVREQSVWWLFYCLSIVWIADIGAYFSGKRFGKTKLVPRLSPGKTKEGIYGAVFATSAYSFVAGLFFDLQPLELLLLLIIGSLATFMSVAGDLFISLLKREKNLKDTGHILPGHGGILDRIDSVLSSAPFLALLLNAVIFDV